MNGKNYFHFCYEGFLHFNSFVDLLMKSFLQWLIYRKCWDAESVEYRHRKYRRSYKSSNYQQNQILIDKSQGYKLTVRIPTIGPAFVIRAIQLHLQFFLFRHHSDKLDKIIEVRPEQFTTVTINEIKQTEHVIIREIIATRLEKKN